MQYSIPKSPRWEHSKDKYLNLNVVMILQNFIICQALHPREQPHSVMEIKLTFLNFHLIPLLRIHIILIASLSQIKIKEYQSA
jgi:hypothetical protein